MLEIWESKRIAFVNGTVVNRRIMQNVVANYHIHQDSEEMFMVESGELFIDFDNKTIKLSKGESLVVKAGIRHRARAQNQVILLVIGGE